MQVSQFLRLVLPDEGYLIVATPLHFKDTKRSAWWNLVVTDIPELRVQCRTWVEEKRDVYFALGAYREKRVWNPTKIDYKTKQPGAWETRTQANVSAIRSLFLDLDVKAKNDAHYASQAEAVKALLTFCKTVKLPTPIIVSSGYGVHVYWPFIEAISPVAWKPIAEKLKNACVVFGLRADPAVTADQARVLRVPGTTNFKRNSTAPVEILNDAKAHEVSTLEAALDDYLADKAVPKPAAAATTLLPARATTLASLEGNIGATNDPLNGNIVVFSCPAMAALVANRGATASEPLWRAGLGVARFCDNPRQMMLAVSDQYPNFTEADMLDKVSNMTKGPTKCASFWAADKPTCESCQHWTKIKSPAQVGRTFRETPPASVEIKIPAPPEPYMLIPVKDGMKNVFLRQKSEEDEGTVDHLVCPYELYPKRIMEQTDDENEADERSAWVAHLPRKGAMEFKMPQTLLSDPRKLHAFLLSRGLHINTKQAKATQFYMTAYLNELAKVVDRERAYERLGWHERHHSFVLPDQIFHRDGTITHHASSKTLDAVTKGAFHAAGDLEVWKKSLLFYSDDVNVSYRVFMDLAWGAPLLHMTGHKGVLIAASGETGRGKTTLLMACASIYGNPDGMLIGGGRYGATMNAMWEILGTLHSVPMFWDDTTERDPEEMSEFMLHISTGKGKERMHGNRHDGRVVTWETIVLSSANTDDVHRVMSAGKDRDPHLMRFISVPFDEIDRSTEAKVRADQFKRAISENYGLAGPIYLAYVVKNYDQIKQLVIRAVEQFDRLLSATSDERHWSATMAVAYVGARIAHSLGLYPFNPQGFDKQWMCAHVDRMRVTYQQAASSSVDTFNEFLEKHVSNTLILSPKQSSHVDNIVNRPHSSGGLLIRNEVDTGMLYVSRQAITAYCTEVKANFRKLEAELLANRVILRKNCYKVLGADTPYAMGQTRCWEIDRVALSKLVKGKKQ